MKKAITALVALLIVGFMAFGYMSAARHGHGDGKINPKEIIYEHLGDAYGWELPFNHSVRIPLPIIAWGTDGLHCFSSSRITGGETYDGFKLSTSEEHHGKLVQVAADGSETRPWDFSITKNVAAIFVAALLVIAMVMSLRNWYRRNGMKAPRGAKGLLELIVDYVYTDTIRPIMGKEAPKYAPYLLTVFFFILTMNLLGLMVIFPGGANLTGNIAITLVLALCTFFTVNLTGTKHYYKEIFAPDVPGFLKPIMPVIEVFSALMKPVSLTVRLFANMLAGHVMILCMVCVIFIMAKYGPLLCGCMSVVSVLFGLFLDALECLVAFIQAYVFTMLSSIYIGLARAHGE